MPSPNLPPCPLCRSPLTIEWEDSTDNYIISYCDNQPCKQQEFCSYTAKFVNLQIWYESFILIDIMLELYHSKNMSFLWRIAPEGYHPSYEKKDVVRINKIIAPDYHKAKLYLLLS